MGEIKETILFICLYAAICCGHFVSRLFWVARRTELNVVNFGKSLLHK